MEMMKNQMLFEELKETLNSQFRMLVTAKARFQQLLAEARANLAADRQELKQKYFQKQKLNHLYYHYMFLCKQRMQWIMYQDMCAIKVVRNAVLENSTVCPSATIQDCRGQYKCPINRLTSGCLAGPHALQSERESSQED